MASPEYLLQGPGNACCMVVALMNAARFFGRETPGLFGPSWERLRYIAGCLHGSATRPGAVAAELGLRRRWIRWDEVQHNLPVILELKNPEPEGGFCHATLVIASTGDEATVVNYHFVSGPVVETVPWVELQPCFAKARAWQVLLAEEKPR